jgi:7-cyano-7-deazaguanine reductase
MSDEYSSFIILHSSLQRIKLKIQNSKLRTQKMPLQASKNLDTFPNPHPNNDYTIRFATQEFTTLCPMTGQPDFAQLTVEYSPDALCLESKSIKQFLWSFRDEGHFHEDVTNIILNAMAGACQPKWMTVTGHFNIRGGIDFVITARYAKE